MPEPTFSTQQEQALERIANANEHIALRLEEQNKLLEKHDETLSKVGQILEIIARK